MNDQQPEYIVEYLDGPLAEVVDRRYLVDGDYDRRVSAIAAIEGVESTFWYEAVDAREVEGQLHVRYRFDAGDSDPVEADQEDNRANDADFR